MKITWEWSQKNCDKQEFIAYSKYGVQRLSGDHCDKRFITVHFNNK